MKLQKERGPSVAIRRPAVTDLTENDNSRVDLSLPVVAGQQPKNAIDPVFDQPGAAFVLLPAGGKFPPLEKAWQERPHSYIEAEQHVAAGGNIGVVAGNGHIGLDQDVPEAFARLELPATTTWETRPGRLGLWFVARGNIAATMESIGKKPDAAQLKLYRDGEHVGELKLQRAYQTIPPSWKTVDGERVDYKLIDSRPPAEVDISALVASLRAAGITFSEKGDHKARLDANASRLEQIGREDRKRRYGRAALEAEAADVGRSPVGSRNDKLNKAAFSAGQLIAAGAVSEAEVVRELAAAASHAGLEPDEIEKTLRSGLEAGLREPRAIPEAPLESLPERLKENPRAIKEPGVIEGLARLKKDDKIEYDLIIDGIKKSKTGIKIETIERMVADVNNGKAEQPPVPPLPEDITQAAVRIAERGKPFKFMLRTFRQSHVGDELHAASQFISFGQQSATNTSGVFDTWEGPSGKGKSDAAKACARQLPEEFIITSSISPKSLYYRAKDGLMLPGSVLYLDDKNVQAGSDLEETLKRIQTFFQEGAEHETVDGAGNFLHTKLPPRLGIIRTTVDSSEADGQLKNRAIGHGVDSSRETDNAVCDLVLRLGAVGQNTNRVTRQTLICRALWRDIKSQVYQVVTPASDKIVEFSDTSNRRNPSLFLDMVRGLACINHRQRHQADGPDGERLLYANYDDYLVAAKLFNEQGNYLGSRLDKAEFAAAEYIHSQGAMGATRAGILHHLSELFPNDGWNDIKVRRLMDGRADREGGGLSAVVPGLSARFEPTDGGGKTKVYFMTSDLSLGVHVTVHDPREKTVSSEDLSHLSQSCPSLGHHQTTTPHTTPPTTCPTCPIKERDGKNIEEKGMDDKGHLPRLPGFFGTGGTGPVQTEPERSEKAPVPEVDSTGPGGTGVLEVKSVAGQDAAREQHFAEKASEVAGSGHPAGEPEQSPAGRAKA